MLMVIIKKFFTINLNKKFMALFILFLSGSFGVTLSESYSKYSPVLNKIIECSINPQAKNCKNIIAYTEILQLREYGRGNFRCQTSLLGAQTELIKNIYFDEIINKSTKISIPFVIKNCKF